MAAMGSPVIAHYGENWLEIHNETIDLLRQVFGTTGDVFPVVASGSAGIDACIGSAFSSGEKVLVGVNGFFGDRLQQIAESYGLQVIRVEAALGRPLEAAQFERAFQEHPDAVGALVVHLETSTTIINPVEEIGPVVRSHGAIFFVDAVSSLGGLPFEMEKYTVDLCASASQKCLGAPPGLAPVAVSERGWEFIDRNPNKCHGWYTDLRVWRTYAVEWGDWHPSPVTMAVNNVLALRASLKLMQAEGMENRFEKYRRLALRLRCGLRSLGMQPYTADEQMAPVLTAAYGPPGVATTEIVKYLENGPGIKISPGLGSLKNTIFRIGHMSPVLEEQDIDEVLEALAGFKSNLGRKFN
jgi:alanine-glyoxylate transaminase/serine-glyoxylate transaminase/serine-pyruvate transaminase